MPFVPLADPVEDDQVADTPASRGFVPLAGTAPAPQPGAMRRAWNYLGRPDTYRDLVTTLAAPVETALNLGSQAVGVPLSGLAGLATEAASAAGLTDLSGGDVVRQLGHALTYEPRGAAGKALTAVAQYPFEKLAEAGQYLGDAVLSSTGSPSAATAVDTAVNSIPLLVAPAVKGARARLAEPAASPRLAELREASRAEAAAAEPEVQRGFVPLGRGLQVERARAEPLATEIESGAANGVETSSNGGSAITPPSARMQPAPTARGFVPLGREAAEPDARMAMLDEQAPEAVAAPIDVTSVPETLKAAVGEMGDALREHGAIQLDGADALHPETAEVLKFLADHPDKLDAINAALKEETNARPDDEARTAEARADAPADQRSGVESAPAPSDRSGHQADEPAGGQVGEWAQFGEDSGTLGIPRAEMPQIRAEHRGALTNFLNARGIQHESQQIPAAQLKATQAEFSPAKVEQARQYQGGDRSILISGDGHVLDGHHQWLAKLQDDAPVKVLRFDAPISDLLPLAREFPSAAVDDAGAGLVGADRTLITVPDAGAAEPRSARAAALEAEADETHKPIPPLKGSDLIGLNYDQLDAMHERAREHNRAVSIAGIRKFLSDDQAKEAAGWKNRHLDRWLSDHETVEMSDWMQARYVNEDLIKDFRGAVNDFDPDSAETLGRSIAVKAKRIDEPGFFETPDGATVQNALRYAREQGWDLDQVLGGMRGRAFEHAGDNAPELFRRLFIEGNPREKTSAAPAAGVPALPVSGEGGPRAAHYALVEADDLRASHDVHLHETPGYPQEFGREGWTRADAEQRVQGIVRGFDPSRLVDAADDAAGAPIVASDGVVEAGNARAVALQRVYQANGLKAHEYRMHLAAEAERLGFDPDAVLSMKKPVLARVPDEPAPRAGHVVGDGEHLPEDARVDMSPGRNYVGFIDDAPPSSSAGAAPEYAAGARRGQPIRREDVIVPFLKALDTSLYEGRVRGKGRLGFFRTNTEEVRVRRHADLETTAHELAHLIDKREPEIRQSWTEGEGASERRAELQGLSYDRSKVYEGFAEFVRLYMTQPEVALEKAPAFSAWFDDFAGRNHYGPALVKAREGMRAWFEQDAVDRARSKIGDHRPLSDALDGRWDAFRQATVDDLHGVYRLEREMSDGKIAPAGPYESARLSRAAASIADGALRFGAPVKHADGSFGWKGRGLQEILREIPHDQLDNALLYFVGRSARELMAQGREHLFTKGEIDGMLKLRQPEFDKAFTEYQTWNKGVLDFAEAHGVINPAARRMWQRTEYLPFHRIGQAGEGRGKPGDWSGVKALAGGTENLRSILENMVGNAAMLIEKAVKNEARSKIAALAEQEGGGKFMARIPAETRPVKIQKEQVIDALLDSMGLDKRAPETAAARERLDAMLRDSPQMLQLLQTNLPPAGRNVVAVLHDGKPTWYEVADPILMRSLEALDRQPPPWIVKWLGLPKRIGTMSVTMTPDFMIANMARDTIMGAVMSRAGFRPVLDSLRGMRMRLTNDPVYKEFVANGGGLSSQFLDEHKFRANLQRFYADRGISYRTVLDAPEKLLNFVESLADAFETSTRLGEYKRAVDAGANPRHAAYLARDISTDFAMKGDSRALGFMYDTVMFLRPALLSWDRLARGLLHDPNRGAIATRAGMMALMSAGLYLLNKDNPRYQDLPDWERDSYWHFFLGDQHFRYPKVWEIGAMSSAAERTTEKILAEDPSGLGGDFARILGNTFNLNLMPQVLAPLAEQAVNRNSFTGAPIETPEMENLQPFLRAKPNTSETLKAAGMATRHLPEQLQMNPARAEALLRGYFNTWALYGLQLTDAAFFGDQKPTTRTDQLPVVRRFYSQEPPQQTKYETQFYDLLGEAKRLQATVRELDRSGRAAVADEFEQARMAGEAKPLETAAKNLAGINRDMRAVRRDQALTPDEKRQRLDQLTVERNDLLKRAVKDTETSMKERQR